MASLFNKFKGAGAGTLHAGNGSHKKKDEPGVELTPLEKMLQNAGPIREDGSDKFFGLENFGNTCYCNSIVQALYHSVQFRDNVLKYLPSSDPNLEVVYPKANVTTRAATNGQAASPTKAKGPTASEAMKRRQAINTGNNTAGPGGIKPEDKPDSPEYKKKMALQKGPVLELGNDNTGSYGMQECTFTSLKDIFQALVDSDKRTGVLSPQRLLDIFKRDYEMFRNSMHQDAHEFYGLVLNDVISTVEANAKKAQEEEAQKPNEVNGHALVPSKPNGTLPTSARPLGAGWVHDIFETIITSETKCLACETTSQRDETFLDLSIDLEEHSSVTSCLRNFSAEEMLCERNKFHCDTCGGLQEAEKRMKIKSLPKVLALHLKRFKYTEDYSRLQKLFHRVVYPYYLRMFDTTDDTEDPHRLYELYAVVIHIGGNAYHGHYVSVIKTHDRGWLLFDDEMVEPVDKHFVKNFFGDKPGMACAYLLLYQETTFEKAQADQEAEGYLEVDVEEGGRVSVGEAQTNGNGATPVSKQSAQQANSNMDDSDDPSTVGLAHAKTAPLLANGSASEFPVISKPSTALQRSDTGAKTKADKAREKKEAKEAKALEKARKEQEKAAEKERQKQVAAQKREALAKYRDERRAEQADLDAAIALSLAEAKNGDAHPDLSSSPTPGGSFLNRANRGSRSMAKKSFPFLGKDKTNKEKREDVPGEFTSEVATRPETERRASGTHGGERRERFKERFSFSGLGRKKSTNPVAS